MSVERICLFSPEIGVPLDHRGMPFGRHQASQVMPGEKLFPTRLGSGDPQDVETAEAPVSQGGRPWDHHGGITMGSPWGDNHGITMGIIMGWDLRGQSSKT